MPLIIWIIDDDLVSQYSTRYRIEQAHSNAKVLDFDSAEIALQAYFEKIPQRNELPDIIFLDLVMPGIGGWRFLEEMKKQIGDHQGPSIYILSAFSNTKDRNRAKEHTFIRGHFDKPLSKIDMESTLLSFKTD